MVSLLLSRDSVRSSTRFSIPWGRVVIACPSMRRYLRLVISVSSLESTVRPLLISENVYNFFISESQSGSSFILHSYNSKVSSMLVKANISSGKCVSWGIRKHKCFNFTNLPIYEGRMLCEVSILNVSRLVREKIVLGRFVRAVSLRSRTVSFFKLPIHSGTICNLFSANARCFNFVKFFIASGNVVSLFLERSKNVS